MPPHCGNDPRARHGGTRTRLTRQIFGVFPHVDTRTHAVFPAYGRISTTHAHAVANTRTHAVVSRAHAHEIPRVQEHYRNRVALRTLSQQSCIRWVTPFLLYPLSPLGLTSVNNFFLAVYNYCTTFVPLLNK